MSIEETWVVAGHSDGECVRAGDLQRADPCLSMYETRDVQSVAESARGLRSCG